MPLKSNDDRLTTRARQGDKEAFGDLYEQYMGDIYRYIYYRVNNHHDAEDLTEQVFLKAWESMGQYRGEVPFKGWVFRIAHNLVIDHYRTRKELMDLTERPEIPGNNRNVEDSLLSDEQSDQLARTIGRLSPLHQHVLTLRFINGLSMEEVARILDRNSGAIRVLQHRALKAARAFMTAEDITDG